jgi:uracil-DNA glycosylase family 4
MLAEQLPGLSGCRKCRRLVRYLAELPPKKGRCRDDYHNAPVPGFGDPAARLCLVGLAPGAHGANRTGRPFTGDGAGDFMYPLLWQAGLANQPQAVQAGDGLELTDLYITNAVKCVPPGNKPAVDEFAACRPYLAEELASLSHVKVVIALGQGAWSTLLRHYRSRGLVRRLADHPFGHGAVCRLPGQPLLLGSYHTSRYNVQTGRIDADMFLALLAEARRLAAGENG